MPLKAGTIPNLWTDIWLQCEVPPEGYPPCRLYKVGEPNRSLIQQIGQINFQMKDNINR